ncbi:MAG: hypothetical protein ACE14O_06420 [Candidatus Cloacimonadaceae bacterium]|nr:hypothetical protein [Candidatus Cloacimonadota bacterium]HQL15622.1 hypothetical protein [Candidatus Cloacimonadota bacterium]
MFILEEKHLEAAKQIALKHRHKKSCDRCYDRGWIGVSDQNLLILCPKCVDRDAALEEWKAYVNENEELKEHFSELFEEKPVEEEGKEKTLPHEQKKLHPNPMKQTFVPGQKRTGLKKV